MMMSTYINSDIEGTSLLRLSLPQCSGNNGSDLFARPAGPSRIQFPSRQIVLNINIRVVHQR